VARFAVATQPITGHVLPVGPVVAALVAAGHEVAWYTGRKFRREAEAAGARFVPFTEAYDYDDADLDAAFPERSALRGLAQLRYDFRKVFIEQAGPQHRDLQALLRDFPADVLVGDPSVVAVATVEEVGGPPSATANVTCLGIPGREVAPFGLGLLPSGSAVGRLRNRALELAAPNVVFREASRVLAGQCRSVGAAPRKFTGVVVSPNLFLQPSVPEFEYPRPDLPPQVHYVGALLPEAAADAPRPTWWAELVAHRRPAVLVTQGTIATRLDELVAPAVTGLAADDVLVVAAGVADPAALGPASSAPNLRTAAFVPFADVMPHVDAFVTNGGYGGVQFALRHGVPIVVAGTTEDKPEIANRVAYSGAGINLRTATPTSGQVADAARSVLGDPRYRAGAGTVAAALARHDGPREAVRLLERLAATRAPVYRPA
jgi:UDP:flavonoid glycosyltransferase YjiC (YdhE family)